MRLLITGGSGYIGAAVLRRAPAEWTLAATYLTQTIAREQVAAFGVDVRTAAAVQRIVDDYRPAVIIHTAAVMTGAALDATNVDGARNVARAAAQSGARLIHLSTDVVFDGEHPPYAEDAPLSPVFPYGKSKTRAEAMVRAECPSAIIVRTSLVYGFDPMDPRTRQTLNGEMPLLFTDEYRCPIFVDDLADALIELATPIFAVSNTSQVLLIHIAGAQRTSRYDFGMTLAHAFGVAPKFQPALAATHPSPRPRDCTLDISHAQKILRTKLRGVDEILRNGTRSRDLPTP